jgi:Domain of unknown function (DUF4186)
MAEREPLKVSCTDSACDQDLHCFRPARGMGEDERGRCRDCGADLVDWETVHRREIERIDTVFAELPKELIRHHYWHYELPQAMLDRTAHWRRETVAKRTRAAIHSRVGPPSNEIFRDGTQTHDEHSEHAQIYFLGMHAVAACCRKCMEYWHGIPRDRRLTEEEERYFAALVWAYVCERMGWQDSLEVIEP